MATGIIPGRQLVVNPNLLDNWCFTGAKLPVNSRGAASYTTTTTGYTVDRWAKRNDIQISVEDDGLHLSTSSASIKALQQPSQSLLKDLAGKTVTASILVKDFNMTTSTDENTGLQYPRFGLYSATNYHLASHDVLNEHISGNGLFSVTGVVTPTTGDTFLNFAACHGNTSTGTMTVVAAKLEIGDQQTLAHLENGVWVLNEVPNYEEQLLRCRTAAEHTDDTEADKTVDFSDRFIVLDSDTINANDLTWTQTTGYYYAPVTFNGEAAISGYRAVSANFKTFTRFAIEYGFIPYTRANGGVGIMSAINTGFHTNTAFSIRAIFEKT